MLLGCPIKIIASFVTFVQKENAGNSSEERHGGYNSDAKGGFDHLPPARISSHRSYVKGGFGEGARLSAELILSVAE